MIEVKADALEASFDAVEMTGASERPMLMGAREPGGAAFEGFLRSGMSTSDAWRDCRTAGHLFCVFDRRSILS